MNDAPIPWYASKTTWAGIVAAILPIANQLSLQFHLTLPSQQIIVDDLTALGTVVAAGIAIYGRITATAPIAKPSTPKVTA